MLKNKAAVEFLCGALRPVIDGRVKPDQLRQLLETDLERMEEEGHAPINVLTRTADAMPGFGIVAAVLGIVITMASIAGPIEKIGEKVAAALVGTFLGIFLGYGFMSPLAVNMEFNVVARLAYFQCISASVVSFASGHGPGHGGRNRPARFERGTPARLGRAGDHAEGAERQRRPRQMVA